MDNKGFKEDFDESFKGNTLHVSSKKGKSTKEYKGRCHRIFRENLLMVITFSSVIIGFGLGFALREVDISYQGKLWIAMPGTIFLNFTKLCVVPIIVCSVISSVATLHPKQNGRVGLIQLLYLVLSNILGATIGTILAVLIKPGEVVNVQNGTTPLESYLQTSDVFADLVRNIFPDNLVRSAFQKTQTYYKAPIVENHTYPNGSFFEVTVHGESYQAYSDGANILGLMFISVLFGLATGNVGERGKPLLAFCQSCLEVVLIMLQWFMWFAPIGILSLMVVAISSIGNLANTFSQLGMFVVVVVTGLVLHQIIIIPATHVLLTRENPFIVLYHCLKAWLVSFAFATMTVALPYVYQSQEVNSLKWDKRITNFAIPIAMPLSKAGSAIFIASACFFLAQLAGLNISIGSIFLIWILVGVSSLALPSVPSGSMVSVIIVSSAVGIPTDNIGLLFAVEWLLDRLRTTSNLVNNVLSIALANYYYTKGPKIDLQNQYVGELEVKVIRL